MNTASACNFCFFHLSCWCRCACGNVSPKTDVYAFGVVLYELISAKQAVVTTNETMTQSKGLVSLVIMLALHCDIRIRKII